METSTAGSLLTERSTRTDTGRDRQTSERQRPAPNLAKFDRFIASQKPQTPFLLIDLDTVAKNYRLMRRTMPIGEVFYAVKANPAPEVVARLAELGSSFDVASIAEIDLVLAAGVEPGRISFGNTIKKERDIAYAYERGVRLYAFDSEAELMKLARSAPGSQVFCRILMSCEGAEWPLSRKFGCEAEMAHDLLIKARDLGLAPVGISFHVGSQQTMLNQWNIALEKTSALFKGLADKGVELSLVNIGGGLPAQYQGQISPVASYADAVNAAFAKHFPRMPRIIIEPGRSLVGDAGMLETEVVLISKKSYEEDVRWVYLDIGKFGGLAETHDEAIKYRIEAKGRKGPTGATILAGPSCDSVDILYEKYQYQLPLTLRVGDRLRLHATGAYTSSYASVGFNGFAPLKTYCL